MDTELIIDVVIVSFCGGLFLLYHLYFWGLLSWCKQDLSTLNFGMEVRRRYIMKIQATKGQEILGVQAMRNLMMSSSLLATLSFTITVGFLAFGSRYECDASSLFCIKILLLVIVCTTSGLFFIWATRAMVHASILISLRPEDFEQPHSDDGQEKEEDTTDSAHTSSDEAESEHRKELKTKQREEKKWHRKQKIYGKVTKSSGRFIAHFSLYFHLGMRVNYLVLPLLLWLLTPWAMLAGTFAMVAVMFFHDHETSLPSPNVIMHSVHFM